MQMIEYHTAIRNDESDLPLATPNYSQKQCEWGDAKSIMYSKVTYKSKIMLNSFQRYIYL